MRVGLLQAEENMVKDITLKDIYFGRADGSQEAEDKNFENLFYKGNKKYDLLKKKLTKNSHLKQF